jgi:predicted TIM-barrel fold metal-dependent hydrolase
LDHFAHAGPETPPGSDAFATDFADYDGVAVKLSAVQHRSATDFPYPDMHDHVAWLLEQFGRERVIWGPISRT